MIPGRPASLPRNAGRRRPSRAPHSILGAGVNERSGGASGRRAGSVFFAVSEELLQGEAARKSSPISLIVATVALLFGAAVLLPAGTAPPAFAQVAPSASVEPSASPVPTAPASDPCMEVDPEVPECHDADFFLTVHSASDPVRDWAIDVTGGVPNVDVFTVPDPSVGDYLVTMTMSGASAIVEMTATLPAGSRLIRGTCFDFSNQVPHDVLVPPRRLVFEVVRGSSHQCSYQSDAHGVPEPTAPPTDSLADAQTGSSEGWPLVLALMAPVMAAGLLIAVRARHRSHGAPRPGLR